jgi:hypothetical protein
MSPTMDDLRRLRELAVDDGAGERLPRIQARIRRAQRRRRVAAAVGASVAVAATVVVALTVNGPDRSPSQLQMTPAQTATSSAAPTASAVSEPTVTVSPTAAPASAAATVPRCATSQLRLTVGAPSGAAGSAYYPLQLQNVGSDACALTGYPGVSFLDAAHRQVGPAADRQPADSTAKVVLARGGFAHATLRVVNAHNYPDATCGPQTTSYLRVFPPDNTVSTEVAHQFDVCTRQPTATVTVLSAGREQP